MKAAFVLFSLLLSLAPILRAEMTDLPNPGDEFPQPLPPDTPGTPPAPGQPPGRISVGDYVLSGPFVGKQYYTGVVVQVSGDGRLINVRDDRDRRVYQRDARLISKRLRCGPRSICEGDRIVEGPMNNSIYYNGTVHSVYERGLFVILRDQDGRYYVRDQSKIQRAY